MEEVKLKPSLVWNLVNILILISSVWLLYIIIEAYENYELYKNLYAFESLMMFGFGVMSIVIFLIQVYKISYNLSITYLISDERLRIDFGVFNRYSENLELYRLKDVQRKSPFIFRFFLKSNLILYSSDKTTPMIMLRAISKGGEWQEWFRVASEAQRKNKGVREFD